MAMTGSVLVLCALAFAWSEPSFAKPKHLAQADPAIIVLKKPALKHKKKHATTTASTKLPAAKTKTAAKPKPPVAETPHPAPPIVVDMTKAIPLDQAAKLPSTEEQFHSLKTRIEETKPGVAAAKQKSDALAAETARLKRRLIATAARVQFLEGEKIRLDADIVRLAGEEKSLAAGFERDRAQVAKLLAVLERLQHDMPPVIAIKSDDALGAARGAMLLGASLPRVYGAAAELSRRLATLRDTRAALIARRAEGAKNADQLRLARRDLDQLLAIKEEEAQSAAGTYGEMQAGLDRIAAEAGDLETLMKRVAALRAAGQVPAAQTMVVVAAAKDSNGTPDQAPKRGSLLRPVAGQFVKGGLDGVGGASAPGITFLGTPGARVVAPADSHVLFAGPYHKTDRVLILEMSGGYDLVLAGLERIDVRSGDRLLAGEPLGTLPRNNQIPRLYFEMRQNGKGISPAPWLEVDLRKAKRT
ncbi:MAG: peptidoglycan DD-metalloendopeptidase family protein [Proteobacteria bacterium]|nr:peptidoglycan DD-metalloendopeptidase family protein [Pseudomonadota bacterium]